MVEARGIVKKYGNSAAQQPRRVQKSLGKQTTPTGRRYFSLYCYLWDAVDKGLDSFSRVAQDLGLTHISVAASYHGGKALLPHNSKQPVYFIEDGAVYFRPASRFFAGTHLRPLVAQLVEKRDYFGDLVEKCRKRGVKATAWTVALHNTHLGTTYPEISSQNVFGNRYFHSLCPSQPGVIAYLRGLARSLASYDIDAVEFETFEYVPFRHYAFLEKEGIAVTPMACLLLSLCFCPACQAVARKRGVSTRLLAKAVKEWLQEYFAGKNRSIAPVKELVHQISGLNEYLEARFDVLSAAFENISALLHEHDKKVIFLTIGQEEDRDYLTGVDLRRVAQHADAVETLFYARRLDEAQSVVKALQKASGTDRPVYCAIRPGYPDASSSSDVAELTKSVLGAGATGVSYYNFGLLEETHMPWIRGAIREARKHLTGASEIETGRASVAPMPSKGFVRPNVLRKAF
jgi:hypothetical protein